MRFLCSNYVPFLSLCCVLLFSLLSAKGHTNDTSITEFVPTTTKKKKIVEQLSTATMKQTVQLRQIIEMQEEVTIDKSEESTQVPRRKKA
ncbi:hypothetical protein [Wolbachia endosymbiont of Brugia pahangi]|uniref:hypothetical protein n=1 Tax=Wolbachia endosymbiont of Brugia pahangi TaxID=96495 RepID=UPI001435EB0D|nr:hypothetical protein WBP_0575 [Wolbachia endosymbiont of Brugia pahangi]